MTRACVRFAFPFLFVSAVASAGLVATTARAESFDITQLPPGSNVTLIKPATTDVPLLTQVRLAATDSPQTVSFKAITKSGQNWAPVQLAIYDKNQDVVKYVKLEKNAFFFYSLKGFSAITVIPELLERKRNARTDDVFVRIESDKPLTVAH